VIFMQAQIRTPTVGRLFEQSAQITTLQPAVRMAGQWRQQDLAYSATEKRNSLLTRWRGGHGRGGICRSERAIADKLSAAGWSWGCCSAVTRDGWRWIVDAHKGDGKRYILYSDELPTAFLELEETLL
jgi:hypothetical protein